MRRSYLGVVLALGLSGSACAQGVVPANNPAVFSAQGVLATGGSTVSSLATREGLHLSPVADFGADPTGTTDSTAAINAALASPNVTAIDLAGGKYLISSGNLVVPAGKGIYCNSKPTIPVNQEFTSLPCLILINPAYTISLSQGSWMDGIVEVANAPAVIAMMTASQTYRDAISLINYMNTSSAGYGVTITLSNDVEISNSMIFGFNIGIYAAAVSRFNLYNIYIDCNEGVYSNLFLDTGQMDRVRVHPFLANPTPSSTEATVSPITAIGNDSGQFQLTLGTNSSGEVPFSFVNGDWVNVAGVTGSTTPINQFWAQVTDVNTTTNQITLAGSTYNSGATGGTIAINVAKRFGPGFEIEGGTGVNILTPWVFGHDIGYHIGNYDASDGTVYGSQWVSITQAGYDNDYATQDPATVGILIDGETQYFNMGICSFVSAATAIEFNSSASGQSSITGCMIGDNYSRAPIVNMMQGNLSIASSMLNPTPVTGQLNTISVGNSSSEGIVFDLCGNNGSNTNISYANVAAQASTAICPEQNFVSGQSVTTSSGPTPLIIKSGTVFSGENEDEGAQILLQNNNSSITNGNSFYLRADSSNGFDIVNNNYSSVLFSIHQDETVVTAHNTLDDGNGNAVVSGGLTVAGVSVGVPPASASIPTNPPVSGTAYQWAGPGTLSLSCPVTFSATSSADATAALDIGSTGTPGSQIAYDSEPAASVVGAVHSEKAEIPAGWYWALTTANATIGTCVGVVH